jgi:plastocyanin
MRMPQGSAEPGRQNRSDAMLTPGGEVEGRGTRLQEPNMSTLRSTTRPAALLVLLLSLAAAGCGDDGEDITPPPGGEQPVYTSLAIGPRPVPSVAVGATTQLIATPVDQNGTAMEGLPAATWASSAEAVALVSPQGLVTGVAAGSATITATLAHQGTTRSATADVTVTAAGGGGGGGTPSATVTTPNLSFSPQSVTIAAGGTVAWRFSDVLHNVTFTGAQPTGGNIPNTSPGTTVNRTFPTAGAYPYQCTLHSGMTGSVTVQ